MIKLDCELSLENEKPVRDGRRGVFDAQNSVHQTNARLVDLRSDEERQRDNINALEHADKSFRKRFIRDRNEAEDAITAAQTELTTRTQAWDAAEANLSNLIEAFHMDETL